MKKVTYKGKSADELVKSLAEKRKEIRETRFGMAGSKTRDVKVLKGTRKEIARILTELNATK